MFAGKNFVGKEEVSDPVTNNPTRVRVCGRWGGSEKMAINPFLKVRTLTYHKKR